MSVSGGGYPGPIGDGGGDRVSRSHVLGEGDGCTLRCDLSNDLDTLPLPLVNRHTPVKTLNSPTLFAGGNYEQLQW